MIENIMWWIIALSVIGLVLWAIYFYILPLVIFWWLSGQEYPEETDDPDV